MTDAPEPRQGYPSLGDLLREARESRGLELSEVAQLTHVRREYLAALEEGRYSELPEDVYTKNFLRLFAQAVGVDTVRASELYRSERREDEGQESWEEGELDEDSATPYSREEPGWWGRERPRPRWGAMASTLVMVAAVVALALWGFNSTLFNPTRSNQGESGLAAAGETGATGAGPTASSESGAAAEEESAIPRTVRLSVSSDPAGAEVSVDEFPLPGTTPIESAPVTARPSRTIRVSLEGYEPYEAEFDLTSDRNLSFALAPQDSGPEGQAAGTSDPEAGAAGEGGADEQGDAAAAGGEGSGEATLTVTEESWLEVYSGTARYEGERLAFMTAQPGQQLRFELPIYVHVGNAGGVELSVAGQERGALGSSGEVRGLAVTAE